MPPPRSSSASRLQMLSHLQDLKHNASDLRSQLAALRKMQVRPCSKLRSSLRWRPQYVVTGSRRLPEIYFAFGTEVAKMFFCNPRNAP